MDSDLKVMQLNARKTKEIQWSALHDESLNGYGALLLTEPSCYRDSEQQLHPSPIQHPKWIAVLPSKSQDERPYIRSMIWMARDLKYTPVHIVSSDITAVMLDLGSRRIMLTSIYVPPITSTHEPERSLRDRLNVLRQTIERVQVEHDNTVELVIAGDFNRHDQLWGGDTVGVGVRQGEAEGIVELMQEYGLNSLLRRGAITWSAGTRKSTIDLMLSTARLTQEHSWCKTGDNGHGSDHRPILTNFAVSHRRNPPAPRRSYKEADWTAIGSAVQQALRDSSWDAERMAIDELCDTLMETVQASVETHVPVARSSPAAKAWWSNDLTTKRRECAQAQKAVRRAARFGRLTHELLEEHLKLVKEYHTTIRRQKRTHWRNFLNDHSNIWKAARHAGTKRSKFNPRITHIEGDGGKIVTENHDIGQVLLKSFFPANPQPKLADTHQPPTPVGLPSALITEEETRQALFKAHPNKAPGPCGLPALVWQQLWPVVRRHVTDLFQASIRTGRLPSQWKKAKILPLKKSSNSDNTDPRSYRPISLLSTLGKALEAVVAARITYLLESQQQLPSNHFGARRSRTAEQALMTLVERVHSAWRNQEVVSLISFDVKGAFNGVVKTVLLDRLRKRRIPEDLSAWIGDFCTDREAEMLVNGEKLQPVRIEFPGIPQGSALSPILYILYNADLVDTPINGEGGAIAFVDDHSAWVAGPTVEDNTARIQSQIIPRAEEWAKRSGASFEAKKSTLIHFTRNVSKAKPSKVTINGCVVDSSPTVKLLGVIMDCKLNFHEHVARAAKRGIKRTIAIRQMKNLRPETTRQLIQATVTPAIDYASNVWATKLTQRDLNLLRQPQRLGAQAIIKAFSTTALRTAETEAAMSSTQDRLRLRRVKFWVELHTLQRSHPLWRVKRIVTQVTRHVSPLARLKEEFNKIGLKNVEKIDPWGLPPWHAAPTVIIDERKTAESAARILPTTDLCWFVDGSAKAEQAGIAAIAVLGEQSWGFSESIRSDRHVDPLLAELLAIEKAAKHTLTISANLQMRTINIFSDCQEALRVLANPTQQKGQRISRNVHTLTLKLERRNQTRIALRWVPAHVQVPGNEEAHTRAKRAMAQTGPPNARLCQLKSTARREAINKTREQALEDTSLARHTRSIDKAAPGPHAYSIYRRLNAEDAAILAQLRTGKCKLNSYLGLLGQGISRDCEVCGVRESIEHFLLSCRRWSAERRPLAQKAGPYAGMLAPLLGGWDDYRDRRGTLVCGPKEDWRPDHGLIAATIAFVKATKRFETDRLQQV